MGRALGGDFVGFYTIGKILRAYPAARIYDLELAVKLQHAILPSMPATQMLVFGQAPLYRVAVSAVRVAALRLGICSLAGILGRGSTLRGLQALFGAVGLQPQGPQNRPSTSAFLGAVPV